MRLITTAIELETEFKRLIRKYNAFYWATAWAGSSSSLFKELILKKNCIKKITVGIHFYQTHPSFIKAFLKNEKVRFIQQPEGTFHPKLYLFFENSSNWELIIGSANFTNEAFTRNTEACILLSNKDANSTEAFIKAKELVEQTWEMAKIFDDADLKQYSILWKNHRSKINSLSGLYGSNNIPPKPIYKVAIINKNWNTFIKEVTKSSIKGRLRALEISKELFSKSGHFKLLTEDERKFIAGAPNRLDIKGSDEWGCFGSMKGNGVFVKEIINNNINISKALDAIPLSGQITKTHYENFIIHYKKAFFGTTLENANNIGTATKLLTMKRPDTFVCFDSKNKSKLCKDFGILQRGIDYDRYWDDIIERIYDCDWWLNPSPKNEKENKVSEARAAFLDCIYFEY